MNLRNFLLSCCCNLFTLLLVAQTYVSTDTQLQNLVNTDTTGDVYIIPDGTYNDFYCSFTANATAANPITIKAETVGGVVLTGDSHFVFKKAAHIILEGFDFECTGNNTLIKLEGSNNIRITRNEFELNTSNSVKWIVVGGYYNDYTFNFVSNHNRIDHNNFLNKNTPGNYITIDGTYNQDYSVTQQSQYDTIDHNYFYNIGPRIENGMESIRIGNSYLSTTSGYTTVAYNYFEDCDGDPEIVSVKSCDNQILHNTFSGNYGTLTLRQGNRTRVEGNYFFGNGKTNGTYTNPDSGSVQTLYTGGIRAYGTDHEIVNNYMEGLQGTVWDAPITITQGDAITGIDTNQSLHYRGERITIANNTLVNNSYGIEIGYAKQNGSYDKLLEDITIANNIVTGSTNQMIKIYNDQNGEVIWENNYMYPTGSAQLTYNPTNTFTNSEIMVQDPNLTVISGIYKATTNTPAANTPTLITINTDIDGQNRPAVSTVGADYYTTDTPIYFPITQTNVGPDAQQNTAAMETIVPPAVNAKFFPNPTNGFVQLKFEQPSSNTYHIKIYKSNGLLINSYPSELVDNTLVLNLTSKIPGMYFIEITSGNFKQVLKIIKE